MPVTIHMFLLNGFRKAQALEFEVLIGATTTSPDSIYGCVKSTILVRLVTIAISPIAASYTYKKRTPEELARKTQYFGSQKKCSIFHTHTSCDQAHEICATRVMYAIPEWY